MANIQHFFPINASRREVFTMISQPEGLDKWWTKSSQGIPVKNHRYQLNFGPDHRWEGVVTLSVPNERFELKITDADADWTNTTVGFKLSESDGVTTVDFYHHGWPESNDHYRTSSYCWAMYLRILKRYLEFGETVPYEERLAV